MSESSSPSATSQCPTCGEPLVRKNGSGAGCPVCLMQMAINGTLATEPMSAPQRAPTLEELAPLFPQLDLLEFIGRGGMGLVYKARQKSLDRLVALKILAPAQEHEKAFAERFATEARALAALDHPNIVTVYDSGETSGLCYLLMEYMDGVNLRQAMRAARVTPEQALAIVPPICEAMQYAHERGIVHRDIKPENLLMNKEGKVKIADFGIAKMITQQPAEQTPAAAAETGGGRMTFAGGTPQYMAPEQKRAPLSADHRADIYSLGVVLYELLTGELPGAALEAPSQKVQIDVRLDQVVLRALERSPELRFQTAGEMRTQLATVMQPEGPPAVANVANAAPKKWFALISPLRLVAAISTLLVGLVLLGAFVILYINRAVEVNSRRVSHRREAEGRPHVPAPPQKVKTSYAKEGAHELTRSYRPAKLSMSPERPAGLAKMPEGVAAPVFGQISFGTIESPSTVIFMLGAQPNKEVRLWVDSNANGDLTDDPPAEWNSAPSNTPSTPNGVFCSGSAYINVPNGPDASPARVNLYVSPHQPSSPISTIYYHADYFRTAKIVLEGMPTMLIIKDGDADGDFRTTPDFAVATGGRQSRVTSLKVLDHPLSVQIGDRLYEIRNLTAAGDSFDWVESSRKIPAPLGNEQRATGGGAHSTLANAAAPSLKTPPLFEVGKPAPVFEATTLTGKRISMPGSFKGKIILLDFWATWCGPCVAQVPHLSSIYTQYKKRGLEIVSVSLDQEDTMGKLPEFFRAHQMGWPQICEGTGRQGLLPRLYRINGIPATLLVDGDTGLILALNSRGEALDEAVREAIGAKRVNPVRLEAAATGVNGTATP